MNFSSPLILTGLAVGVVVGLIMRYFIFRASCALVDVEPTPFKSILVVLFALAITLAVGVPIVGLPLGLFSQPLFNVQESVSLYILWCLFGLVLIWAILGLLCIPALPVAITKGLLLSGYEVVLGVLANALLVAVILVLYAVYQIGTNAGAGPAHTASPAAPQAATAPHPS